MKDKKTIIWLVIIVAVAIGLMIWGSAGYEVSAGTWEDTDVLCLPAGHSNLGQHIHPTLRVIVDGVPEEVPANIGVSNTCMAETHTHDNSGEIHLETVSPNKEMVLGDFFDVWGETIEREGFETRVTINGEEVDGPESVILRDRDRIVVEYTSVTASTEETEE